MACGSVQEGEEMRSWGADRQRLKPAQVWLRRQRAICIGWVTGENQCVRARRRAQHAGLNNGGKERRDARTRKEIGFARAVGADCAVKRTTCVSGKDRCNSGCGLRHWRQRLTNDVVALAEVVRGRSVLVALESLDVDAFDVHDFL